MLIVLFIVSAWTHASSATTKILFDVHQRRCEVWLSRVDRPSANADRTEYEVERLSLPLHGAAYRAFQWMSRVKKFDLGSAFEIHAQGVGNRFAGLQGLLLGDIVEGPAAGDPYRDAIARARAEFTPRGLELAREALAYARGSGLGRALEVTVQVIMPNAAAAQAQRMLVLLPDSTYPEGVILSGSGSLPTFRRLLNVLYGEPATNGALIRPVRIEEAAGRPPSFRAIASRPRSTLPPRRVVKKPK